MKVCLIVNPGAGTAHQLEDLRAALAKRHRLTVRETTSRADLEEQVRDAARSGKFAAVAVAGGDGTLHAAVAALGPEFPRTPLAFLPLGTGNDLCRTLGIPLDPLEAAKLLRRGRRRSIDVVRIDGLEVPFIVNAATGGFSGRVAEEVTTELKQAWGPLAYLRGAAGPVTNPPTFRATFRFDGGPPETRDVLNVVVANGRTAAGGILVAPTANPEDGMLDVVVIAPADTLDLSVVTARLLAGDYLVDENVTHRRCRSVQITSEPPMPLSADGELVELRDATFTAIPKAIRVYLGPDYRPDPAGEPVGPGGVKRQLFALAADGLHAARTLARWPRSGWLLAAALFLLFAVIAVTVKQNRWADWNLWAAERASSWRSDASTDVALVFARLFDPDIVAGMVVAGVAALAAFRRRAEASWLVVMWLMAGASELLLKPWLAVPRPENFLRPDLARGFGFPSGHALRASALTAFAAGAVLGSGWRRVARWPVGLALLMLALMTAASRVYLGVHSLADVTAGLVLGAAWALTARAASGTLSGERR